MKLVRQLVVLVVLVLVGSGTAAAQAFPPEAAWVPFYCNLLPMRDGFADEVSAIDERDVVGNGTTTAAGMHAADAEFLYLRLQLDQDPGSGNTVRPFGWGFELDIDGNPATYEIAILVDAIGGGPAQVVLLQNTTTTVVNSPNDPADSPPVMTFPTTTHARSVPAAVMGAGGDADFWLEIAMPWSALVPLGMDRATPVRVWAGSSNAAETSLDGDLACHDGATGSPTLDGSVSDVTTGDPVIDTDGDGFSDAVELAGGSDPNDPSSTPVPTSRLEGGGGCSAGGRGLGFALVGLLLAVLGRKKRRRA